MFEKIYIEISNICNLQCSFCPEVIREKKIISPSDFRRFALQARPLTKQVCLHLMGEPLAHPEFLEIMKICDELGLKIFLTTNGTLIKRYSEVLLSWKSLVQINFSIHSYFANSQRQTLDQYLDPIFSFCTQALKRPQSFYINLRLWNLSSVSAQSEHNLKVLRAIENEFSVTLEDSVNVKLNKSKRVQDKLYLHFDTEFEWPTLKREELSRKGTCYGLRKQLAIHANGDVVPCCLDKEALLKLGSLYESNLTDILKTQYALKIKTGFEQGQLTQELCRKCQFVERFR
jgi:radical SAM protein with 4Fe4S-binding SPASM domain